MRNNANSEEKKKKKATLPPQIFNEADYIGVRFLQWNRTIQLRLVMANPVYCQSNFIDFNCIGLIGLNSCFCYYLNITLFNVIFLRNHYTDRYSQNMYINSYVAMVTLAKEICLQYTVLCIRNILMLSFAFPLLGHINSS